MFKFWGVQGRQESTGSLSASAKMGGPGITVPNEVATCGASRPARDLDGVVRTNVRRTRWFCAQMCAAHQSPYAQHA